MNLATYLLINDLSIPVLGIVFSVVSNGFTANSLILNDSKIFFYIHGYWFLAVSSNKTSMLHQHTSVTCAVTVQTTLSLHSLCDAHLFSCVEQLLEQKLLITLQLCPIVCMTKETLLPSDSVCKSMLASNVLELFNANDITTRFSISRLLWRKTDQYTWNGLSVAVPVIQQSRNNWLHFWYIIEYN